MNIQVVLLSVVLAAFVGLWSNDHPTKPFVAIPTKTKSYPATGPMSATEPKDTQNFTAVGSSPSWDMPKLPSGIAAGTYLVVNHLGDIKTLTISVSDLGQTEVRKPQDLYLMNADRQRWYFIRIDEAADTQTQTAVIPDGPVLK